LVRHGSRPLTCIDVMEVIMRIRQAVIPIILALSVAGSILASSAIPAAAVTAPGAHVVVADSGANPYMFYHE
jgi:hypothetical protein